MRSLTSPADAQLGAASWLLRALHLTVLGLVLAGIVHLLVVLLMPRLAQDDAWAKLSDRSEMWSMLRLATAGEPGAVLPETDPALSVAGCRFDLRQSPLAVTSRGLVPFWSVSILDRRGRNVYSFNDRTAVDRELTLLVVDPVQMATLRKNPPEDSERAVLIEAPIDEGIVLIRVLQPDPSWRERTETFLGSTRCAKYELAEEPQPGAAERVIEDVPEG